MSPPRFPTLRLNQVVARLETRFHISARPGKGSELVLEGKTIHAEQFRKYCVGRHQKNREIPQQLLRAILRRFEISIEEFFEDSIH